MSSAGGPSWGSSSSAARRSSSPARARLARLLRTLAAKVEVRCTHARHALLSLPSARSGVRTPAHLSRCLESLHAAPASDEELRLLWASFPAPDEAGFDWKAMVAAMFPRPDDDVNQASTRSTQQMQEAHVQPSLMAPASPSMGASPPLWHSSVAPLSPQQYAVAESRVHQSLSPSPAVPAQPPSVDWSGPGASFAPHAAAAAVATITSPARASVPTSSTAATRAFPGGTRPTGTGSRTSSRSSRTPPTYMLPVAQRRSAVVPASTGTVPLSNTTGGFRYAPGERVQKKPDAYALAGLQFGTPIRF